MKARHLSHLALILQIILALFFCWTSAFTIFKSFNEDSLIFIQSLYDFLPCFVICIASLITEIILTVKHKSHLSERELLPLLFLFITLQNIVVLPKLYFYSTSYPIYYINGFIIASRFVLIMVSVLFLFSSLIMIGAQIPKNSAISTISCVVALMIALIIPIDTNYITNLGGNDIYNSIFVILIIVTFVISIILNTLTIFSNEVTNKNIEKNIAFCFMLLAEIFIVFNLNAPALPFIGVGLYVISNILLIASSNNY